MVQPGVIEPPEEWTVPDDAVSEAAESLALLTMLAHDIRSPLHTIGLSCELLTMHGDPADTAVARQLDIIRYTVAQIDRLVGDVLSMSTSDGPAGQGRGVGTRVAAVLAEAAADHSALAEVHGVALTLDAPDADCRIQADRASVLRVLANLITNAVRFTPSGGSVAVSACARGDMVEFAVRDTGRGMPETEVRRMLEHVPVARQNLRRHGGVGLWIVRRIVEAHGGSVSADSGVGRGSSFIFELPAAHMSQFAAPSGRRRP